MLSFINMGGRKGRRHRRKNSRNGVGNGTRGKRRTSRGSGSFASPGNIGEFVEKPAKVIVLGDTRGNILTNGKGNAISPSLQAPSSAKRSPEIEMEFKHDSLLQSLPEEFLKHRKGSSSSTVQDVRAAKSSSHATDWTSNAEGSPQGRRLTQEKRRMAPLPTVAPIKIPPTPLKTVSAQPLTQSQRRLSNTRRSGASNTFGWASDSEISPVSGLSAARDVIGETFSFSARTTGFLESAGKEKETANRGSARQDSATLPREAVWEGAMQTSSMSRRSSSQSMKKRKRDTSAVELPPFDVALLISPLFRIDEPDEKSEVSEQGRPPIPPRKDSILGHRREGSAGRGKLPPGLTPSTQKLDQADQAALHRISRIVETDAEGNVSSPQPASGSTTGSFSSKSKNAGKQTAEAIRLQSLIKVPSVLSTPSTYSKYTISPLTSPGRHLAPLSAGASSSKSDYDYESFLEDFEFVEYVGQSSGPSSRGDKSGFSGSASSPYEVQVPMTAATFSSINVLKSTPAAGSSGFPQDSPKSVTLQENRSAVGRDARREEQVSPSVYSNPSPIARSPTTSSRISRGKDRKAAITSNAIINKSPDSKRNPGVDPHYTSTSRKDAPRVKNGISAKTNVIQKAADAKRRSPTLKLEGSGRDGAIAGRRRPSVNRFRVTNPEPSSPGDSPQSCHSPDLLDMLIPDGHIVTPISRRQIEGKRSGSTPSPIKITPSRSARYLPMNGDEDDHTGDMEIRVVAAEYGHQTKDVPNTGDIQTFPETPALFSPDVPRDALSRSNSALSTTQQPKSVSHSLLRTALAFQPIVIPSTPQVTDRTKVTLTPSGANDRPPSNDGSKSQHPGTPDSPPISPLQPPPNTAETAPSKVQTLIDTARPSPPLLGPVPVPKRRTVHVRPPLPFGPRKPNNHPGKGTPPLSFVPRRSASESAAVIAQGINRANPQTKRPGTPLSTPTFKTTPVPWRGLTLDAAKWTFSSAQLQAIVRAAIEQSAQASSIRLLPQDVSEKLPLVLSELEARRAEIQKNYKVIVRRRRSIIQRLTSLSLNGLRVDTSSVVRDAEELATITATGDKLTEELHDLDDQITQIHRIQDVHQASALAVALRKLNASLLRQTSEAHKLQMDMMNMYAERDEAWRKAEELEHELDALHEKAGSSRPKSVSNSRRSSRVSLAKKGSLRASKTGLRLSGYSRRSSQRSSVGSSLQVHHPTSSRTTFSSDMVPPVPPLPIIDSHVSASTAGFLSSRPSTSMPHSSGAPSNTDNLYHAVYDLLGVKGSDRDMPSPRPRSEICCTASTPADASAQNTNQRPQNGRIAAPSHIESATRLRSGSLPTLIPAQREAEAEETGAIIAMLDFHD